MQAALEKVSGVESAEVSFDTKLATIKVDTSRADADALIKAVNAARGGKMYKAKVSQ